MASKTTYAVPQIGASYYWDRCLWWVVKPVQRSITNLLINPSFERGVDGWVGMNANTNLSLSQDESFRGLQSLCVQSDTEDLYGVRYDILVLAGRTYCATFWVKGCAGDALFASFASQVTAGILLPQIQEGSVRLELTGDWQEVQLCLVNGTTGDLAATLSISTTRVGHCDLFYLDAVAMVDNDEPVSYFDGDQHGATWNGVPHASPSTAAAGQRQEGTPVNLQECGLNPIGDGGWGMPPVEPVVLSFARRPGALYQRSHVRPRPISIRGTVEGCPCAVHQVRQKLVELVGLWDVADCEEEFLLRYQWTNDCGDSIGEPLEIPVTYVSGLEEARSDLQRQIIELGFCGV
ncbi:hypothetical protein KFU94_00645 [Chloroflexi bacterium TSY]|nr:hypothetical protein [Chloroflexi bacterium TSY]